MIHEMRNLRTHWKGYPHHHLPRIRCASSSFTPTRNQSLSHEAAKQVSRKPFSAALLQERLKRRIKLGRRRVRRSRSSSSVASARRRNTERAQQHIQVFGWETPQAEMASRTSKMTLVNHNLDVPSGGATVGSLPVSNTTHPSTLTSSVDSTAASCARKAKITSQVNYPIVKKVVEVPIYWRRSTERKDRLSSWVISKDVTSTSRSPLRKLHAEPSGTASVPKSYHDPQAINQNRNFDHRIDPKKLANILTENPSASQPVDSPLSQRDSPEADERSPRSSQRQTTDPSAEFSNQSILADTPERTPSQKKALRQFTKGLELYVLATSSLPKKSLIPSPSATTISANTIEELQPYQDEFKAAGLAVTSDQQQRKSLTKTRPDNSLTPTTPPKTPPKDRKTLPFSRPPNRPSKDEKRPPPTTPPKTPPKDDKWVAKKSSIGTGNSPQCPDQGPRKPAPSSSGTAVIDSTPLREDSTPQQSQDMTSFTLSSDHTVIAFTPPHEEAAHIKLRSPTIASPPKKSLPWLRQPTTPTRDSSPTSIITSESTLSASIKDSSSPEDHSYSSLDGKSYSIPKEGITGSSGKFECTPPQLLALG